MCFECVDGLFGNVAAVDVRWDKLKRVSPYLFDLQLVGGAAFVVENLQVNAVAALGEVGHDAIGSG